MYQLKQTVVCIDIKGRDYSYYRKSGLGFNHKLYKEDDKHIKMIDGKDVLSLTVGNKYEIFSTYDSMVLVKCDDGEYTKFRKDRFVTEGVYRSLKIKKLKELCSNQVK